ncbi:DUF1749-domain-containing protein [Aaosphaeria arxii CBS 175.79]|uniref:DUF1749-domain-containing protein n=1 Tax=Aaosphaeria arxii CBS 175.79 TaxID=1450172 RepID=A0A6A5XPE4_9PLEO|nr:DUF1749-domain-containing protein [Aaosphaeria arxii CBS 175.79]KAF2015012.1 DUF1749-domain-containing protein [Aaosphaeria arxii CBS 175.79]
MPIPSTPHPGLLHPYAPRLVAFEHTPSPTAKNTILFVGGLSDGLLTIPYVPVLASSLPPEWSLATVLLSSSYSGWATSSLASDADELAAAVAYFQGLEGRQGGKVVLMGHSTGCQDVVAYHVLPSSSPRPKVDGIILQGGVSDRQAWEDMLNEDPSKKAEFDAVAKKAREWVEAGRGDDVLPREGNVFSEVFEAGVSAYRTDSLVRKGGDDDFFSDDLGDEVLRGTFGRIGGLGVRVMFVLGGEDPYVPRRVDKRALVARWTAAVREGGGVVDDVEGGVLDGAGHNLDGNPEEVVRELVERVVGFVKRVEGEEK